VPAHPKVVSEAAEVIARNTRSGPRFFREKGICRISLPVRVEYDLRQSEPTWQGTTTRGDEMLVSRKEIEQPVPRTVLGKEKYSAGTAYVEKEWKTVNFRGDARGIDEFYIQASFFIHVRGACGLAKQRPLCLVLVIDQLRYDSKSYRIAFLMNRSLVYA
jgi:hypothetical protein